MKLKIGDKVTIIDLDGSPLGEGTILSVNNFREEHHKYAVDVGHEDVIFCGENHLIKQEEK